MGFEEWLPENVLLLLTFLLALGLEIFRYLRLRALFRHNIGLGISGADEYYLLHLLWMATLGPLAAVIPTFLLTRLWRFCLGLPLPLQPYAAGVFLLLLAGFMAFPLFFALYKARATVQKVIKPLLVLLIPEMACFLFEPLRWIFGGTLVLLVTSAVGQKVRFTGWQDLVDWVQSPPEEVSPKKSAAERLAERLYRPRRIRIVALTETEAYLSRSGEGEVEVEENLADPEEAVAPLILDAGRLATLVESIRKLEERADLLQEIPRLIARNAEKIAEYKKKVEQEEGTAEKKERRVAEFIRQEVFEAAGFGEQMRSLLYWHYDLPKESVRVSISRAPRVRLVPLLSWAEYFGLFLGKASAAESSYRERRR